VFVDFEANETKQRGNRGARTKRSNCAFLLLLENS